MKNSLWVLAVFAIAASPAMAQQGSQTPTAAPALPMCTDASITARPTPQTQISLQDSYPPLSVILGEEGDTRVVFVVKSNGTVDHVQVDRGSGSLRLDDATVNAVRQILYSPPKAGNVAVSCTHFLIIKWRLSSPNAAEDPTTPLRMLLTPPRSLYPPAAVAKHEEGFTEVEILIGRDGKIANTQIGHSSNSDELNAASVAYVKSLDPKPGSISGTAAPTLLDVTVIWALDPPAHQPSRN